MRICKAVLLSSLLVSAFTPAVAENIEESIEQAQALSRAFSHVAEQVMPSVVNISAVQTYTPQRMAPQFRFRGRGNPLEEFFGDELFGQLFPRDQYNFPNGGQNRTFKQQSGMGTGFIFDEEGHILTNNHVIEDADEIEVKLFDNTTYKAEIVGRDEGTDLAVLKIKADKKLTPAKLGNSDVLKIGEWVVAVGNPFGLDHTITTGVVSAKGRSISPRSMKYEDYIQTDAAINPGNSGGPLVNLHGEVVGINSAIFSKSGGYMGIGFAIPIDLAKSVLESLTKNGRVVRGWLGVAIQNLTEDLASSFGYTSTEGALIGDITQNGPAAKAGLRTEDIITKFANKEIKDVNQLRLLVAATAPKSVVPVEVYRNGKTEIFNIEVGELQNQHGEEQPIPQEKDVDDLGMVIQTITPQIRSQLGYETEGSLVVTDVAPYSIAANAGLRPMDVIIKAAGQDVHNQQEFSAILKANKLSEGIRLVVETSGMKRFVVLRN